jgi:hypothetical protein
MNRATAWVGALLLAATFGYGCGGGAPPQVPPATPAAPAGGAEPGAVSAPPPPPPAPSLAEPPASREAQRSMAASDLARAQRDLELATSDCATACRALASMASATARLCSLADEPPDQRRCEDAKVRLTAARSRVRAACGACP